MEKLTITENLSEIDRGANEIRHGSAVSLWTLYGIPMGLDMGQPFGPGFAGDWVLVRPEGVGFFTLVRRVPNTQDKDVMNRQVD